MRTDLPTTPEPAAREVVENELAPRLRLVFARVARLLRQHSGSSLTASLQSALAAVSRSGPVTLGELAGIERIQPPSMTRIVARLEEQQLVRREVDGSDRRVARVTVTDEGRALLQRSRTERDLFLAHRIADLDPAEVAVLEAVLPILERLAGEGR
jgi:DNA-binding MarR family transcriptional regulator